MKPVIVAKTFLDAAAKLERNDRARAFDFMGKFMDNPSQPGLSLERMTRALDPNMWSARVSRSLRAAIHRVGDKNILLYVGQHDDVYNWAERRRVENHPQTGSLQIIESVQEEPAETEKPVSAGPEEPAPPAPGLFDAHADEYLLSIGVPEDWLATIRTLKTEEQLYEIIEKLPEEVAERLVDIHDGRVVTPPKQ